MVVLDADEEENEGEGMGSRGRRDLAGSLEPYKKHHHEAPGNQIYEAP